jgi:phosphatidylglycerol:prolipoprotein diacylglycerol transferase
MLSYVLYFSILYCFLIFYTVYRAKKLNTDTKIALDIALILMVGGFVGARLMHVLYEEPQYYVDHWVRIFQFWAGGFVFYGGFLLAISGASFYVWKKKESWLKWADFYAPICALGYGLGRIGCLLAGCCYGRACDFPWAITLSWDEKMIPRHPTQIYATLFELLVFFVLIWGEKLKNRKPGMLFFSWILAHGFGRVMMEYFRDDFRGPTILNLSISTWTSLVLISAGVAYFLSSKIVEKK